MGPLQIIGLCNAIWGFPEMEISQIAGWFIINGKSYSNG
jgi:hypothetical protein